MSDRPRSAPESTDDDCRKAEHARNNLLAALLSNLEFAFAILEERGEADEREALVQSVELALQAARELVEEANQRRS